MMESYLRLETNIGINSKTYKCMAIHPSEMHMVYSVGSMLVIKSVDNDHDEYLYGHSTLINFITVSNSGNLIASSEAFDSHSEESAALIVWDFYQREILYRVRYHKQMVRAMSFNCTDDYLASIGGLKDGN